MHGVIASTSKGVLKMCFTLKNIKLIFIFNILTLKIKNN